MNGHRCENIMQLVSGQTDFLHCLEQDRFVFKTADNKFFNCHNRKIKNQKIKAEPFLYLMRMRHLMCECLRLLPLSFTHLLFIVIAGFLQNMFYFSKGNHRKEFREQKVTGEKQSEGSQVKSNLPDAG